MAKREKLPRRHRRCASVSEADSCNDRRASCKFRRARGPQAVGLLLSVIDIRPEIQFATMYDDKIAVRERIFLVSTTLLKPMLREHENIN